MKRCNCFICKGENTYPLTKLLMDCIAYMWVIYMSLPVCREVIIDSPIEAFSRQYRYLFRGEECCSGPFWWHVHAACQDDLIKGFELQGSYRRAYIRVSDADARRAGSGDRWFIITDNHVKTKEFQKRITTICGSPAITVNTWMIGAIGMNRYLCSDGIVLCRFFCCKLIHGSWLAFTNEPFTNHDPSSLWIFHTSDMGMLGEGMNKPSEKAWYLNINKKSLSVLYISSVEALWLIYMGRA